MTDEKRLTNLTTAKGVLAEIAKELKYLRDETDLPSGETAVPWTRRGQKFSVIAYHLRTAALLVNCQKQE